MKTMVMILLTVSLCSWANANPTPVKTGLSTNIASSPKEKKDQEKTEKIKKAIENRRYVIIATQSLQFSREDLNDFQVTGKKNGLVRLDQLAYAPTGGLRGTKEMRTPPPFYLSISPDSILINLPYCGIEEKDMGTYFDYKEKISKKGNYTINFKVTRSTETYQVNLVIKPNGECSLTLIGEKRDKSYTFYGYIQTEEKKPI